MPQHRVQTALRKSLVSVLPSISLRWSYKPSGRTPSALAQESPSGFRHFRQGRCRVEYRATEHLQLRPCLLWTLRFSTTARVPFESQVRGHRQNESSFGCYLLGACLLSSTPRRSALPLLPKFCARKLLPKNNN